MGNLSDYGDDDEVRDDIDARLVELVNDLRREAEGLKVDGRHSQLGSLLLYAADTLEDSHGKNEYLLDKLLTIEDLVSRTLRSA